MWRINLSDPLGLLTNTYGVTFVPPQFSCLGKYSFIILDMSNKSTEVLKNQTRLIAPNLTADPSWQLFQASLTRDS